MRYKLKCLDCGATQWCQGDFEADTNAANVEPGAYWDGGRSGCDHSNYEIVDSEPDVDEEPEYFGPDHYEEGL